MPIPWRARLAPLALFAFVCLVAAAQDSSVHQYRGATEADQVTRVFYAAHLKTAQQLQPDSHHRGNSTDVPQHRATSHSGARHGRPGR